MTTFTRIATFEELATTARLELTNLSRIVEEHSPTSTANEIDMLEAYEWVGDAWETLLRSFRFGADKVGGISLREVEEAFEDAREAVQEMQKESSCQS